MSGTPRLIGWVAEMAALTEPRDIVWCDGSDEEYRRLCAAARRQPAPSSRSIPSCGRTASSPAAIRRDVARVEDRTFICSQRRGGCRPDQQLDGAGRDARRPERGQADGTAALFRGAMRGRTMYVVPFSMGPLGSPIAHIGVELTDSPYVAVNMRIMTRMGRAVLDVLGADGDFVPCMHTVGAPLEPGQADVAGRATRRSTSSTIPRRARSGATARATAATRCSARSASRCASPATMGRDQGWLAEHMLILGVDLARGQEAPRRRGLPERLRQDQLRDADPAGRLRRLEGDDHRRRHRLDQARRRTAACTPSIPRPATSASPPAPTTRPTPTAWRACGAT